MRFGVLIHRNSVNIGDHIQSVAVRNLLPKVDSYIDRDTFLDHALSTEQIAVIVSGWISHRPENWPPAGNIIPLLTSLHISEMTSNIGKSTDKFVIGDPEYLREWSPVGSRDLRTLELLQAAGVDSHFSACVTLTLDPAADGARSAAIVCTDVPANVLAFIRTKTRRPILSLTHYEPHLSEVDALARADEFIDQYRQAHCVVTTRIHCALPCLAVGTPVLFLDPAQKDARLRGLDLLFRHCAPLELIEEAYQFDFDDPPANDLDYLKYRAQLISAVQKFVADVENGITVTPDSDRSFERRFNSLWAIHLETMQDQRAALEVKDKENAQLRSTLTADQQETEQLRHMLDVKSEEISRVHAALKESQADGAQLRGMLDVKDDELSRVHAALGKAHADGTQLRRMLDVKDDEISRLRAALEKAHADGAQLREMLNVKDDEISHLQAALATGQTEGAQLRAGLVIKSPDDARPRGAAQKDEKSDTMA